MDVLTRIKSLKKQQQLLTAKLDGINHELDTLEGTIREALGEPRRAIDVTPPLPEVKPAVRQEAVDLLRAIDSTGPIHEYHKTINGRPVTVREEWVGKEVPFDDDAFSAAKPI